jgi:CelD/BcsL family acetyltransferase involved in cellulose biosynthesis
MTLSVQTECIQSLDDKTLWPLWQGLEQNAYHSVFQSSWYMKPLLEIVAPANGAHPCIVMVFDQRQDTPIMLVPFVSMRRHGQRVIMQADFDLCDYCAPVFSRNYDWEQADIHAIWEQVLKALPASDVLSIKKMPTHIEAFLNPLAGLTEAELMGVSTMRLQPGVTELPTKVLREVRYKLRKLDQDGGLKEVIAHDPKDLHALLDCAIEQRAKRCEELKIENILQHPEIDAFYRALIDSSGEGAAMVGYGLKQAENYVAVSLGIVVNNIFNGLILSIGDHTTRRYSPGICVATRQLQWAAESGCRYCDMGVGGAAYKSRFGGAVTELMELEQSRSPIGVAGTSFLRARRKLRIGLQSYPQLNHQVRRLMRKV